MARTIRRKHYVPSWVTETWEFEFTNHRGRRCFYGYRQLEGEERARKLRWWHEDKSCFWGVRPRSSTDKNTKNSTALRREISSSAGEKTRNIRFKLAASPSLGTGTAHALSGALY